jgi:hypothetical protein
MITMQQPDTDYPPSPKTLIVGDIHGCYDEFQALLDKSGIGDHDRIIALGDVVDRGPASPQALAFFQQHPQANCLMGNHERKHVRHQQGELRLTTSQRITLAQFSEQGQDYDAAVAYMATLPLSLELPEAILTHGYLEPGIPLDQQRATVLAGTMSGGSYLKKQYDRPWYELYRGDKPVVVGHRNYTGTSLPFVYQDHIFGLDTGVYTGKALSGLLLPDFRLISVPARANHWLLVRRAHADILRQTSRPIPPEERPWPRLQSWLEQAASQPTPTAEQQAEQIRVERLVAEAQAAQEHLPPALTTLFDQECQTLYTHVPNFDTLPRRQQGKWFDAIVSHHPPLARQMLHRLRQGHAVADILAETLNSPARVLAAWGYLNSLPER